MNAKRQTIPMILTNANHAIYQAFVDSGIAENSKQAITWYIATVDGPLADGIKNALDIILPDLGGFDSHITSVIYERDGDWSVVIDTLNFTFDFQNVDEFSKHLFKICKIYCAEYQFWAITR